MQNHVFLMVATGMLAVSWGGMLALTTRLTRRLGRLLALLAGPARRTGPAILWSIIALLESYCWAIGLSGVGVVVEDLAPGMRQAGLTERQLQTDVELRLRQRGIAVLTQEERRNIPGAPDLYVRVSGFRNDIGMLVFSITVELNQQVYLEPNFSQTRAATWSIGGIGTVNVRNQSTIRNELGRYIDQFISTYLSDDPRVKSSPADATALSSASPPRDLIRRAQQRLLAIGLDPGAVDGAIRPQTREALRWFQKRKGLCPTGEPNEATLDALGVR
jgi:hypothetical protein